MHIKVSQFIFFCAILTMIPNIQSRHTLQTEVYYHGICTERLASFLHALCPLQDIENVEEMDDVNGPIADNEETNTNSIPDSIRAIIKTQIKKADFITGCCNKPCSTQDFLSYCKFP